MVRKLSIGVIGIQGAVSEHEKILQKTYDATNISGNIIIVNHKEQIKKINGLIIPGGESTTISKILVKLNIYEEILKRIKDNSLPIMGTCAGCILLANNLVENTKDVKLLNAIEMKVKRNAFGRQKESFESIINIEGFHNPYNAVFIRAPIIEKVGGKCKILSKINNKIIMTRQDKYLAMSFHPELTDDIRIHKYFLDMV
ncbi:MAG: pyridoxal 5'-phosphate synthase glutaminase subunit PdxT [Thermoplasmatales archaeon]|nr:MAG: pyridoxal 5'-phosphate synthase glutaminase subunit PdxT [Thermoplasmatales archaeon]